MFDEAIEKLNAAIEAESQQITSPFAPAEKRTYTVEEIQSILGISRTNAYRLVNSNQFRIIKIGNTIRVPVKAFDDWLEGNA